MRSNPWKIWDLYFNLKYLNILRTRTVFLSSSDLHMHQFVMSLPYLKAIFRVMVYWFEYGIKGVVYWLKREGVLRLTVG